jgi:thymidylate synthase (FAD)
MKILLEPKVTLVGCTRFFPHSRYELPDDGTDAERLGAFAAKACYDSYGKDGRSVVSNQRAILEQRHGSVIEHSYASFFVEGVTRALTLELNRHRLLNISQRSTRYTEEGDAAIVLEPYYANIWKKYSLDWNAERLVLPSAFDYYTSQAGISLEDVLPKDLWLIHEFVYGCQEAIRRYDQQVQMLMSLNPLKLSGSHLRKWARGKARNILPHALETRATYTANHRAWRWICEVRSGVSAEPEIRRLISYLLPKLKELAPRYYEDFEISEIYDGLPVWKPAHSKV